MTKLNWVKASWRSVPVDKFQIWETESNEFILNMKRNIKQVMQGEDVWIYAGTFSTVQEAQQEAERLSQAEKGKDVIL